MMKNCSGIIRLSPFAMEELTEFLVSAQSATCYSGVSRNNRYFFSRSFSCVLSYERITSLLLHQSVSDHRVAWIARPTCAREPRFIYKSVRNVASGFSPSRFYPSGARITSVRSCGCACVSVKSKKASCWTSCIVQPCVTKVGSLRR